MLRALRERLLQRDLFEEFCDEFTSEMNRLRMERRASLFPNPHFERIHLPTLDEHLSRLVAQQSTEQELSPDEALANFAVNFRMPSGKRKRRKSQGRVLNGRMA